MDRELITTARNLLNGKIRLLIVDDDADFADLMVSEYFASPLFENHHARSLHAAREKIGTGEPRFHCWIIDLTLKYGQTGFALLPERPEFPFKVVLSGTRSLENAARAIESGAWGAFDKDPEGLFSSSRLFMEVCHLGALSFCLKARCRDDVAPYRLLTREFFDSPEMWAYRSCMSQRKLQRRVANDTGMTPKAFLTLYHAVHCLICYEVPLLTSEKSPAEIYGQQNHWALQDDFYTQCIRYLLDHWKTVVSLML